MPTKPMTPDEHIFLVTFGERLSEALERRKMTQMQLAKDVGVNRARISQIVKGCPKAPCGIILFKKICSRLPIDANYLLGNRIKKKKPPTTNPIRS